MATERTITIEVPASLQKNILGMLSFLGYSLRYTQSGHLKAIKPASSPARVVATGLGSLSVVKPSVDGRVF